MEADGWEVQKIEVIHGYIGSLRPELTKKKKKEKKTKGGGGGRGENHNKKWPMRYKHLERTPLRGRFTFTSHVCVSA